MKILMTFVPFNACPPYIVYAAVLNFKMQELKNISALFVCVCVWHVKEIFANDLNKNDVVYSSSVKSVLIVNFT